jgi:hypothetical protein
MARSGASRPLVLRTWLIWTAGFLAFPIGGFAGTAVAGRVDSPVAALLGGARLPGSSSAPIRHRPVPGGSTCAGGYRPPRSG